MKHHTLTSDSDPDFSIIWLHFFSCTDKQWWFDTKMVERNLSFVSLDLEWHVMSPDKITWWKLKVFDARSLRTACRRCTREQILFLHCDIVYHIRPLDLLCLRAVIDPEGSFQTSCAIPYQTDKKLRDKSWSILDVHALQNSLDALQSACGARAESWAALWSVFRSACRSACTSEQIQYFSISSYCKDKE